ncbi:multidrug effflux MFS transporter [Planctobacterium marinum]|uniref:Bcr/CflA family efflux transporter n=1 Tax=Planctobacterium marinum TaxID=1631968 RepID=A0AA48KR10_9ALTE|nr:MFS transporter [Planctobacterium marinum]
MDKQSLGKGEFIALFALLMSLTALTIDAMLPALPDITRDLRIENSNNVQLVISLFILGTVFGELLFGAFADAFGRKKTVVAGVAIYLCGTVIAIFATSLWLLLLGRVLQGFGISGSKIGSRALIRDLYKGEQMAQIMSVIMVLFILVPMMAPFLGQLVMLHFGWRAIFVAFLIFALVVVTWFVIRQPETLTLEKRIPLSFSNILNSLKLILRHRRVMSYCLVTGFTFGAMLVYLSTSQAMFEDFYDVVEDFPLYFALLAAGVGASALINSKIVVLYGMHRVSVWALLGIAAGSLLLLLVTWLNQGIPPMPLFLACFMLILFFMGFIFGNINAMSMEWLGGMAGIGNSIVGSLSSLTAVGLAVLVGRFYDGNAYPVALCFFIVALFSLWLLRYARRSPAISL